MKLLLYIIIRKYFLALNPIKFEQFIRCYVHVMAVSFLMYRIIQSLGHRIKGTFLLGILTNKIRCLKTGTQQKPIYVSIFGAKDNFFYETLYICVSLYMQSVSIVPNIHVSV